VDQRYRVGQLVVREWAASGGEVLGAGSTAAAQVAGQPGMARLLDVDAPGDRINAGLLADFEALRSAVRLDTGRDGLNWFQAVRQLYSEAELAAELNPDRLRALNVPLGRLARQGFPVGWPNEG
jgi:hypothetical protein